MIRWNDNLRGVLCAGLIFGSPAWGASTAALWWAAAHRVPAIAAIGYGPIYWLATAAAIGTTTGMLLIPCPPAQRVIIASLSFMGCIVVYSIGFWLFAMLAHRTLLGG